MAAGRLDKPAATGEVPPRLLAVAAVAALVGAPGRPWLCGLLPAGAHALTVLGGWTYDLWLKPTPASFVPYAVAFGALPAVVTLSPRRRTARGRGDGRAALLGLAAHFTNTVGDT